MQPGRVCHDPNLVVVLQALPCGPSPKSTGARRRIATNQAVTAVVLPDVREPIPQIRHVFALRRL